MWISIFYLESYRSKHDTDQNQRLDTVSSSFIVASEKLYLFYHQNTMRNNFIVKYTDYGCTYCIENSTYNAVQWNNLFMFCRYCYWHLHRHQFDIIHTLERIVQLHESIWSQCFKNGFVSNRFVECHQRWN